MDTETLNRPKTTYSNGSVHAIAYEQEYGDHGRKELVTQLGLTIRQHFASLALQGLLTKYILKAPEDQETVCKAAVELADELIIQLNHHRQ